jgi:hypothetical protein
MPRRPLMSTSVRTCESQLRRTRQRGPAARGLFSFYGFRSLRGHLLHPVGKPAATERPFPGARSDRDGAVTAVGSAGLRATPPAWCTARRDSKPSRSASPAMRTGLKEVSLPHRWRARGWRQPYPAGRSRGRGRRVVPSACHMRWSHMAPTVNHGYGVVAFGLGEWRRCLPTGWSDMPYEGGGPKRDATRCPSRRPEGAPTSPTRGMTSGDPASGV